MGIIDSPRRVAPDLEPHQSNRDFVYGQRFATRLALNAILEGCVDRISFEDAAYAAFHRHAYTLAQIGGEVSRDPSTVCRWIQRAAARLADEWRVSSEGDDRARNKI